MPSIIQSRLQAISALKSRWRVLAMEQVRAEVATIAARMSKSRSPAMYRAKSFDASEADCDDVIEWGRSLDLPQGLVCAYWIVYQEGVEIELSDFLAYHDDLWFPGADDVWITSRHGAWVIEFDHEEELTLWLEDEKRDRSDIDKMGKCR